MNVFVGSGLAIGLGFLSLLLFQPKWLFVALETISPRVLYFVETEQMIVALTIDDGPDATETPVILDVLARHNVQATFFLVSNRVDGNETLVARLIQDGHEIGNHLKEVVPSITLPPDEFEDALQRAHDKLSQYGELSWFRPGSGWYNQRMLRTIAKNGYQCALGSLYPYDAQHAATWFSERQILQNAFPGGIIILHDSWGRGLRTAAVLDRILPELKARGYQVTTLSELVDQAA